MDVEQFVKDVLIQVTTAINTSGKSSVDFRLHPSEGIDFDLAVATTSGESSNKGAAGGIKIKVIGVEAGKNTITQASHEAPSRIKFNVLVN